MNSFDEDLSALKDHLERQFQLKNQGILKGEKTTLAQVRGTEKPEVNDPGKDAIEKQTRLDGKAISPSTLEEIQRELVDCRRCRLCETRNHLVFGAGNPRAELMFIGEAPGAEEDLQGEPFVGRAGQLLSKIIAAIGKTREEVYIANIIKCRPPGNRNPEADEIAICSPFLDRQIEAIRPRVICALGKFSAQTMLASSESISRLRGRVYNYKNLCQLVPTFHPAYLLRSPERKKETWEDMQLIMKLLGNNL
ncbi:MAG: uracil-DNA glycosylase [Deltaproteobacteria bacterium]|nr:uracil-DNA glycosylase [Deltaproteobacteria bacterium]